ncbi:type II secretion system secretin GspD [Methylomonas sp. AM2-LC]|uniref:type II secretion system secretin GspD n=1 Tax=Methylomonas sp. AM2-LC TaxID=3153301 RepID=UPI003265E093
MKRIKLPLLTLALSMAGCEFIGPQMQTKLPLPQLAPAQEDTVILPQDTKLDDSKKTTKVEVFPATDANNQVGHSFSTDVDKSGEVNREAKGGKGEYSLNFDDADLGEVAKVILSDILGKNYTLSPQVTGKVTLQTTKPLTKEELLPALDMLLSVNNAAMVNQNGLYVIKPSTEALYSTTMNGMGGAGYQLRVIPIRNVAANEIAEIIKPLLPEKSLLQVDDKRNILLVAGSGSELKRVLELINIFDVDVMKGNSFALITPAHADAGVIIDELEQIFNNATPTKPSSGGKKEKEKDKEGGAASAGGAASPSGSFYRFIEIDRLNAILAVTHRPQDLTEIETWVRRLDKTNSEGKGGVNVYRVQHHPAMALANTLNVIFGNRQQNTQTSIASGRSSMSGSNSSGMLGSNSSGIGGSNSLQSGSSSGGLSGSSSGMSGGLGSFGSSSSMGNNNTLGGISSGGGGISGGQQALLPNVKIIADESNNALIIVGNAQEYATVSKVLKQLDVLPMQVLIDATIAEVKLTNDLQYGIEWFLTHGHNTASGGSGAEATTTAITTLASGVATGGFSYIFNSKNIMAVLQAQATYNNVNVISSPSLMVLNNGEATILVGDSVPIQTGTVTSSIGGSSTTNSYTDTGVSLGIKPRVNANGLVLMDIMQSVNAANSTNTSTINSPTISKRQIQTNVAVQSGETVVLGGMIQETNTNNTDGVPWLHEIPYLGSLFGGTTRDKVKSELVILLTPRVMKSRQDAQDVTEEFKRKLTGIYDDRRIPAMMPETTQQ